jgi:hypothetical protein
MFKLFELAHFAEAYQNKKFAKWFDTCAAWFDRQDINADIASSGEDDFLFRVRLEDSNGAYYAGIFPLRAKSVEVNGTDGKPVMEKNKKGKLVPKKRPESNDEYELRVEKDCSDAIRQAREGRMVFTTRRPIAARIAA